MESLRAFCAGLAAYIGVDAVIVRVVFLLSVLIGGTGVIVYLVLWLIVPEAKTSSQNWKWRVIQLITKYKRNS